MNRAQLILAALLAGSLATGSLVALVIVVPKLLGKRPLSTRTPPSSRKLPYRRREALLTLAERSFYRLLSAAVEALAVDVFAKVRLEDLIEVRKGAEQYQAHRNRIKSRHVDFVLCDREKLVPLLVLELNDASHGRADRQERDDFLGRALGAAGIPLLWVSAPTACSPADLARLIQQKIPHLDAGPGRHPAAPALMPTAAGSAVPPEPASAGPGSATQPAEGPDNEAGACPQCGWPLVPERSDETGQVLLACSRYPECQHAQPLPPAAIEAPLPDRPS